MYSYISLKDGDETLNDLANIIKGETAHKLDIQLMQINGETLNTFNFEEIKLYQKDVI